MNHCKAGELPGHRAVWNGSRVLGPSPGHVTDFVCDSDVCGVTPPSYNMQGVEGGSWSPCSVSLPVLILDVQLC